GQSLLVRTGYRDEVVYRKLLTPCCRRDARFLHDHGCRGTAPEHTGERLPQHLPSLLEGGVHELEAGDALGLAAHRLGAQLERHEDRIDVGHGPEHLPADLTGDLPFAVPGGLDARAAVD